MTGDGVHDIQALVAAANADPRRGAGHARELTKIPLDSEALAHLAAQDLHPGTVPGPGAVVTLRRNANLSTGGTSIDVTGEIHPDVAAMCCRAAAAVGLDVCGIDLRLPGISSPPRPGSGAVIELNASPGLRMHLAPSAGRARDVASAIIDRLYPPGVSARVPIVSVTGTNGKTTTVRMIGHILRQAGLHAGMTTTEGVTNITADHFGMDGITDLDDLAEVKSLVAEEIQPGGTLILNGDDPRSAALARRGAVLAARPVIRYFSLDSRNPVVVAHRLGGGMTCELADGQLVETHGGEQTVLLDASELPGSCGGAAAHLVSNALAACAACRALGVSVKDIKRALATFTRRRPTRGAATSTRWMAGRW